jgi:glycerol transport system ATP-binding protein
MHQGRMLQHAPALEVYHRPASVEAARVFSDPPMNIVDGVVRDGALELLGEIRIPVGAPRTRGDAGAYRSRRDPIGAHLAGLADGPYRFGIRASDCRLQPGGEGDVAVRARVELSEISGSETFVYLRAADAAAPVIVQQDGVFHHQLDDELTFYLDPDRLLAFGPGADHPLVASYHPAAARSDAWPR